MPETLGANPNPSDEREATQLLVQDIYADPLKTYQEHSAKYRLLKFFDPQEHRFNDVWKKVWKDALAIAKEQQYGILWQYNDKIRRGLQESLERLQKREPPLNQDIGKLEIQQAMQDVIHLKKVGHIPMTEIFLLEYAKQIFGPSIKSTEPSISDTELSKRIKSYFDEVRDVLHSPMRIEM